MSDITNSEYQVALDVILARAATDSAFRTLALQDPAAAIKAATGLDLPPGTTVEFVEAGKAWAFEAGRYTVPLPPANDEELTDSDLLDHVSGGVRLLPGGGGRYNPNEKADNPDAV